MAAHFAHVTEEEIDKVKEDSISTKTGNKLQNMVITQLHICNNLFTNRERGIYLCIKTRSLGQQLYRHR